ncbi:MULTISPECIES: nucleoside triphosphate pyrophosphohydrolase [Streptomyces]|uniref:nucleoside triphosphate pyrophosphohydrolase n=1 Tax=Streptomyces TaxID=1883 RepID=UPI0014323185|nr:MULTISPECIES: nucleoside triphosphate pyrophosphohydrolase [Streptomyces]MDX3088997.1 nucleoside triphosphate pyrophosphohydrolase [Streptomyces sp. ME12-02E]MDX3330413.1 nucleoside triphosphate pyrophosphohydrolase [Streptomyces sp. ME02-6978a]NJP71878.1 nucleoside triphosphate pyrophosphohydrolase [Streptomyces sp. C1-2]
MNATGTEASADAPGRIVLLTTSHRVAPGLLSWPAWQLLRTADRVLCADGAHPQLPYLREAGVEVDEAAPEAGELVDACAGGRTVVVLATGEGEPRLTDGLARMAGSGRFRMPDLELLPASYDLPGARLLDLVQVMDRIRRECPWSSGQTHEGLAKYAIEEAYELVEAIEDGDREELREELGDVLLQVVFHARIAEEDAEEPFSVDDVAGGIVAKLIHRHPHVFGEESASTPEEVKAHWLRTKAEEKRRDSVTEGVPLGQPGLALAAKLASRARTAGLDVPLPAGEGVGYELLALAARAEAEGVDPEAALRAAARAYRDAIRARESDTTESDTPESDTPR